MKAYFEAPMWILLKSALLFLLWAYFTKADGPRWDLMHQDGYAINVHRIEVPWFNKSYLMVENAAMVKFNRTFRRVFNASGYLLKEIGKNFTGTVQLFKLTKSNQYRFFPFTATFQLCQEYERNTFGSKDIIAKFTNLKPCPQKPGYVYAINLYTDHSRLPPLIPTGDYKAEVKMYHESDRLVDFQMFAALIPTARVPFEE